MTDARTSDELSASIRRRIEDLRYLASDLLALAKQVEAGHYPEAAWLAILAEAGIDAADVNDLRAAASTYEVLAARRRRFADEAALVEIVAGEVAAKLSQRRYHGTWSHMTCVDAVKLLVEEVGELISAIDSGVPRDIISESADVAAYAGIVMLRASADG
jgi:phosphoribosyl-ATP pyrophosphohydrolase